MDGGHLREARRVRGWTQQRAAAELGLSQTYLSLLERGRRPVTAPVVRELRRVYRLPPTAEPCPPVTDPLEALDDHMMATQLRGLGYPGFAYLNQPLRVHNPALTLAQLLVAKQREPRVVEGAPWVANRFRLDWGWLGRVARLHDMQNRLGFVVALAAERFGDERLRVAEQGLLVCKLEREATLCDESMSIHLREWVRANRTSAAVRWNVLSDLRPEFLP